MASCVCKKCKCQMIGHFGDDVCLDCAFPALKAATDAGAKAVEKAHFDRTGEKKTFGEILRESW